MATSRDTRAGDKAAAHGVLTLTGRSQPELHVLHLLGPDTPSLRADACRTLVSASVVERQSAVACGGLPPGRPWPESLLRVSARPWRAWGREVRSVFRQAAQRARPVVVHAWSPGACGWALAIGQDAGAPVLIDCEFPHAGERLARWFTSKARAAPPSFVCPTARSMRRMLERGAPLSSIALIRDSVDFGLLRGGASDARAALGAAPDSALVLALPPLGRRAGFHAAWSAMLAQKVVAGVRLLIPGTGRETDALRHLARACRHEHTVHFAGDALGLPELMRAADLALFVPIGDTSTAAVAWAMAAGRPIVASAVPAVTELLAHGANAWLCRPADPRDTARRILNAIEETERSRRQADLARMQAYAVFGRQRMIEQYSAAWANLAGGRAVGEGVTDPALAV